MQFPFSIGFFLSFIWYSLATQATFLKLNKTAPLISFPLKRSQSRQGHLHPQILLQQRMNRGALRLAHMTRHAPPSQADLEHLMRRRVHSVEGPEGVRRRFHEDIVCGSATTEPLVALDDDSSYVIQVNIGTPGRTYMLQVDSGSSDTWVGSSDNCTSEVGGGCGNHEFLGTQTSSTFYDSSIPWKIVYGSGDIAGTIVKDDMALGDLVLKNQIFGVAHTEGTNFASQLFFAFDGIMGCAKQSLSQQKTITPLESLASQGLIPDRVVSFKLSRFADNLNDAEITLGGLDESRFDPRTAVELPVEAGDGLWEIRLSDVIINGINLGLTGRTALIDTGTSFIYIPQSDAEAIHSQIQGAKADGMGGFTVPCTMTDEIALDFTRPFTIDPRDIVLEPANSIGDCVSAISGSNGTNFLLGDAFIRNVYVSFSTSKDTVMLADLI